MSYANVTLTSPQGDLSFNVFLPPGIPNITDESTPHHAPIYYTSSRFDHSSMIGNIQFHNQTLFDLDLWRMPHNADWPESGMGLASEFGVGDNGDYCYFMCGWPAAQGITNGVLGYRPPVQPGESFLKIGVGELTKGSCPTCDSAEDYKFNSPYRFAKPPQWTLQQDSPHHIQLTQTATLRNVGYTIVKDIHVTDQHEIHVTNTLTNLGTDDFSTVWYSHNFFHCNGRAIGPGYQVSLDLNAHQVPLYEEPGTWSWATPLKQFARIVLREAHTVVVQMTRTLDPGIRIQSEFTSPTDDAAGTTTSSSSGAFTLQACQTRITSRLEMNPDDTLDDNAQDNNDNNNHHPSMYAFNLYVERGTLSPEPQILLQLPANGGTQSWTQILTLESMSPADDDVDNDTDSSASASSAWSKLLGSIAAGPPSRSSSFTNNHQQSNAFLLPPLMILVGSSLVLLILFATGSRRSKSSTRTRKINTSRAVSQYGSIVTERETFSDETLNDEETSPLLSPSKRISKHLSDNSGRSTIRTSLCRGLLAGLVILLVIHMGLWLYSSWGFWTLRWWYHPGYQHAHHPQTLPTVFSLRNDVNGTHLHALHNPLYDRLRNATFVNSAAPPSNEDSVSSSSAYQLTLEPTRIHGGEPLTVRWTSNVQDSDVLTVVCEKESSEASITERTNLSWQDVLEVGTIAQLKATHAQTLLQYNTRAGTWTPNIQQFHQTENENVWFIPEFPAFKFASCQMAIYRPNKDESSDDHPELNLIVASNVLQLTSVTSPVGVHLSAGKEPTDMVVSFSTGEKGTPVAYFGTDRNLGTRATGTSTTYTASDLCMEPANETEPGKFTSPGMLHTIVMQNLLPNTTYYYKVGLEHGQGVTWSEVYSFIAPILPGDMSAPFTYLVYADQGCPEHGWFEGAAWTAAMVESELPHIRAVHHFGDLSYAKGAAHQWDAWLAMIEPIAARVPYHVSVGNHEYDYMAGGLGKDPSGEENAKANGFHPQWGNFGNDSGGECGVPTANRFTMPSSPDSTPIDSNGVFWYSHEFGGVHTVVLSSEHDLSFSSRQYEFLVSDLSSVDRQKTPWVVVELHRPFYESEKIWDQNAVGIGMRYEFEHVLADYQVDLVLSGHYHAYLRTCNGLYRNNCENGGPVFITVGTAGAALDWAEYYENDWTSKAIENEYGYGRITVYNSTSMLFEFVKAGDKNDNTTGDVLDQVWVPRNR